MHYPIRFATIVAVALAFTACTDSAQRALTEPGGVRFSSHLAALSPAQETLLAEIRELQQALYACDTSPRKRQLDNKAKDITEMEEYAQRGWWDDLDNADKNVAKKAAQLIADTKALISNGTLPATCSTYGNAAGRAELADNFYALIELFASEGESLSDPDATVVLCPAADGCEEPGKVSAPPGTFGQDVAILFRKNDGNFPDPSFNAVGQSWHVDLFPADAQVNNAWTRCIEWEGFNPGVNDLNPGLERVRMVREDESGELDFLPTEANACPDPDLVVSMSNPLVRGAYKLFAGFPFLPKELHAYSPPRTFGGTSTASSPHWLVVLDPEDDFDSLCLLTYEYSPSTANAGCTHLSKAKAYAEAGDNDGVNAKLDDYINVVEAQRGQSLTDAQATELIGIANSLRP
jgi:hypothetical protein